MAAATEDDSKKKWGFAAIPWDVVRKVQLAASYSFPAENTSLLCNLVLIFFVGFGWFFSGINLVTTLISDHKSACLNSNPGFIHIASLSFCHFSIFYVLCCCLAHLEKQCLFSH